jgi:predicted SAM-dependent methyltransferase
LESKSGSNIVKSINDLNGRVFDVVYTAHTLEHFTDLSTIFRDIYHLLNVKGKLLIEVPNFDYAEFGEKALSTVGAVHPIGFSSEFFKKIFLNMALKYWDLQFMGFVSQKSRQ